MGSSHEEKTKKEQKSFPPNISLMNSPSPKNIEPSSTKDKSKKKLLSIAVFGAGQVGKSSIIKRYGEDIFEENIQPGPLPGIMKKSITDKGEQYMLRIIDTNSLNEEKFTESFLLDKVNGIILVYNMKERNTFEILFECFKTIFPFLNQNNVSVLMLANKEDEIKNKVLISEKFKEYIKMNDLLFFECSAKTGSNINTAFEALINKMK